MASLRSSFLGTPAALAALAAASALTAQQTDPIATSVAVRVQLADGTPMPGVSIRRAPRGWQPQPAAVVDGWLRETDHRLREVSLPNAGRTAPDGTLTLLANDGYLGPRELLAAAPFRTVQFERDGTSDRYTMQVERLDHFAVRALDVAGVPLVDFPLTLQQNSDIVAVAITDARGIATFGVDPATTVRLVVVPLAWFGPVDAMPTVAKQLPDKFFDFTVPAFGRVRVRANVGGVPKAVRTSGARVTAPRRASLHHGDTGLPQLHGVELGPVAVGQVLQGSVRFERGEVAFTARAPRQHGDLVVVDVDAEPARAELALRLVAPALRLTQAERRRDGPATVHVRVEVALVTERGRRSYTAEVGDDGRLLVHVQPGEAPAEPVRRIDVDVLETEHVVHRDPSAKQDRSLTTRSAKTRLWSGTQTVDLRIEPKAIDLGAIELSEHGGLLRGRVVDDGGRPIADARVEVTAGGALFSMSTSTDETGEFAFTHPLMRDADGRPAAVVATASAGTGRDTLHSQPCAPTAAGGFVTLQLPAPARGYLQLSLRDTTLPVHALQFAFVEATGRVRELDRERCLWQQDRRTCRLGPLPVGRGTLRIQLRPGVRLREVADVEVRNGEVFVDARLQGLDLSDAVTICRMRVVDEHGVPMPNARVAYHGASDQWSIGPSDRRGELEIVKGPPGGLRIVVSAPGKQSIELDDVRDGADIRMRPTQHLCITVRGLPADVPRADIALFLRPVVRENLADAMQAQLGADDIAHVPLPPPGRYHLRLTLRQPGGKGESWTYVGQRADDVVVGKDGESLEFVVDEAMVRRLRELAPK